MHPDDAPRLARFRKLAALRSGRPRVRQMRTVWHDTPDAALAAQGLSLAERRHGWRLERSRPDGPGWPPGAPPPLVSDAPDRATLPQPLMPWAACEGRAAVHALADGASVTVLSGVLRAVASERDVCRVRLDGPEASVVPLALAIAAELRLSVPSCSLADEALSLARNAQPPPRRLGPPVLDPALAVGDAFAQVAGHLADVLLHFCALVTDAAPEPVHQARVAMRRLRSALSVFARATECPDVAAVAADLKALGGLLGPARDWDVFTAGAGEDLAAALPDDAPIARLRQAAERRRLAAYRDLRAHLEGPAHRLMGLRLAALSGGAGWRATVASEAELSAPLPGFARHVLSRRLKRMTDVGDDLAGLPDEQLHALRLDGKRLRYACEFFAPLFPGKAARRFLARLEELQERLGALNDGVVAASLMAELPAGNSAREHAYAVGAVRGYVAARGERARPKIAAAWSKLRKEQPFWG